MKLNLVSMAACGVVGAVTVCGMVLAAPYITPVQHNSASPNHPMFAAFAHGAQSALTFSSGDGAGGAPTSGSSAPGADAQRDAPVPGVGDSDGTTAQAAYSFNPHGSGVTLGSLERISAISSNGGFAAGGSGGSGGFGGMGGGAGGGFGGRGSPSLGSGGQPTGNSGTDDVGDVDLNSLADASSAHPLKAVASVVPEPSTWAMMIVGVGMLGMTFRRRSPLVK